MKSPVRNKKIPKTRQENIYFKQNFNNNSFFP